MLCGRGKTRAFSEFLGVVHCNVIQLDFTTWKYVVAQYVEKLVEI